MIDILIKAGGFILIIMLGFALKTKGVCTREHGSFLSTIIMNITLPCSLLSSINNLEITPILLVALACGFLGNVITNLSGYLIQKKESPMTRALSMINSSGYNIGTFTLPFVQSFFPSNLIGYVCLFDTGNALMGFSQYFLQPHQQGEPLFQYHLLIALLNFSHLLKAKYALLHNQ